MYDIPIWIDDSMAPCAGSAAHTHRVARPALLAEFALGAGGIELRGYGWTPGGDVQVFAHFPHETTPRGPITGAIDRDGGFSTFVWGCTTGGAMVTVVDIARGESAQVRLAPAAG